MSSGGALVWTIKLDSNLVQRSAAWHICYGFCVSCFLSKGSLSTRLCYGFGDALEFVAIYWITRFRYHVDNQIRFKFGLKDVLEFVAIYWITRFR